jgi:hypothetical protein
MLWLAAFWADRATLALLCSMAKLLAFIAAQRVWYVRPYRTPFIPYIDLLWEFVTGKSEDHRGGICNLTIPLCSETSTFDDPLGSHLLLNVFDIDVEKVIAGYDPTACVQSPMRLHHNRYVVKLLQGQ